jgi:hypothetical protein
VTSSFAPSLNYNSKTGEASTTSLPIYSHTVDSGRFAGSSVAFTCQNCYLSGDFTITFSSGSAILNYAIEAGVALLKGTVALEGELQHSLAGASAAVQRKALSEVQNLRNGLATGVSNMERGIYKVSRIYHLHF